MFIGSSIRIIAMASKTFKRFYKQAAFVETAAGFAIQLDGKAVKTPGARPLEVPSLALAESIAAEWQQQGEEVRPAAMPMTQLATTALDRVGPERHAIQGQLMGYAATDLLCYRAEAPSELVAHQAAHWQPLLDWAALALDAPLNTTAGVLAVEQPPAALAALARSLDSLDPWRLTAVQAATAAAGSLVLALALEAGRLSAEAVFDLSQLDETFQIERWGEDYEAADRRSQLRQDIDATGRLLDLL
jgi:chaperone required for assembly of F1-ATPase